MNLHHYFCVQSKPEQALGNLLPAPSKAQLVASDSIQNLSFILSEVSSPVSSAWSLLWTLQPARNKQGENHSLSWSFFWNGQKGCFPGAYCLRWDTSFSNEQSNMKSGRETYTSKLLGWNEVKFGKMHYISWRNPPPAGLTIYVFCSPCLKPQLKASVSTGTVTKMLRYVSAISSISTCCLLSIFLMQLCMFSFICSMLILKHTNDLLP